MTCDISKDTILTNIPQGTQLVNYSKQIERCVFDIELYINAEKFSVNIDMTEHFSDIHIDYYNKEEGSIHGINAVRIHNPGSNDNIVKFLKCLNSYVQEAYNSYRTYVHNMSTILDVEGLAREYQYIRA